MPKQKKKTRASPQKKKTKVRSKKSSRRSVASELNQVLAVEKNILAEEKRVESKEDVLAKVEARTESMEAREDQDLKKLEKLEVEIKNEVGTHPLMKITIKDVVKGLVGAFVGLAVHYTFVYGVEISERISVTRALSLYILAFIVGLAFIYATGFRKIKDKNILVFMPVRLIVLYAASVLMSIVVLYLFYPTFGQSLEESFKMVAGVLLAAVVGACTADLIGKE